MVSKLPRITCIATFVLAAVSATAHAEWSGTRARQERKVSVMAQTSWNGLSGSGFLVAVNPIPYVSLDLGGGFSTIGIKSGARLRANLLPGSVSPFVGVGYFLGSGTGTDVLDTEDDGNEINFRVLSSQFVQAIGGINWMTRGGFTLMGGAGWAWRTTDDPVSLISGTPNKNQKDAFDLLLASGVVIELNVGYSF